MAQFPDAVGVGAAQTGQPGFCDLDERYRRLSENGDPLVMLAALIDFAAFRPKLATALKRPHGS